MSDGNGDPNGRMMEKLENIEQTVNRIDTHVTGGLEPHKGLNMRVLILERDRDDQRRRTRNFIALCTAAFSVVGAGLFDWFKSLFHGGKHP